MTTFATLARRTLTATLVAGGLAGVVAPAASAAEPKVTLKVSTKWAVVGFPVTATVTSDQPGTLYLSQIRRDGLRTTGPTYCGHPEPLVYRAVTSRPITAGTPVKITIQPARLAYYGGDLLNTGTGCWNQATPYDRLSADVQTPGNASSGAMVSFSRVL